ncbi:PAS domain S-box-containing protein [Methanococcoides vulcani]|uniref:histidine kinase n=1 Tax=Methanococcoides vulcani TaxID=1353158 RepID=A0A1H9ZUX1_9EURY|nr:ATP-binding protein [Methanococcoides vulcani]SES85162.1 PAS domain S-box-containing protein [Methanococcoides vulcani]
MEGANLDGSNIIQREFAVEGSCKDPTELFVDPEILSPVFEDIPMIMILVNQDGKVEYINRTATIALGKEKKDSIGLLGGELFGCMNSIKGEGCGKNRECSECTVRNSVMHTFETGESIYKKEGELEIVTNNKSVTLNFLISTTLIQQNNEPLVLLTADDITEQKNNDLAFEEAIRKQKALEDIINNSSTMVFLWRAEDFWPADYTSENVSKLGYSAEDFILGRITYGDLVHPDDYQMVWDTLAEKCEDGSDNYTSEYRLITKDGKLLWVSEKTFILRNGKGQATHFQGIVQDITERKEAEEAMLHAKLAAEAANTAKTEFISNINHELRTPLTLIIGFSNLLCSEDYGSLNEQQKKYISTILNNGNHLLKLINDLLDFSNIETGEMELHVNEFRVSDAIDEIEALMVPLSKKKGIDLTCNIDIEKPTIKADMPKFKHILYNLVNNSIKFTGQGGAVTIGGKISDEAVDFFVKDIGIGISPEDQEKLFKPFFQVDSSNSREYGGTGLGLALVKKFVEMHGGEVWVESELGKGSTFGFSIPNEPENPSY